MPSHWNQLLRQQRVAAGLSREQLAARAGVSRDTVVAYELGRRPPTRTTLVRLAGAASPTTAEANRIVAAAGFHPEPDADLAVLHQRRPAPTSLAEAVRGYDWPCLVVNERMEIVGWNAAAIQVGEWDFATQSPTPRERNMLRIAAQPHFRQRALNWDAIVSDLLGLVKGEAPELLQSGTADPYFLAVVNDIATHHSAALPDLMRLWTAATPYDPRHRNIQYPHWRTAAGDELRFNTVVVTWSDFDALYANDWQPADAFTCEWLANRRLASVGSQPPTSIPAVEPAAAPTWFARLRAAREQSGLTRRQLATLTELHPRTLDNWETGRHTPDREGILHFARAMRLDGGTTNAILAAAGLEPEPSDWALFIAQQSLRVAPTRYELLAGQPPASLAEIRREIGAHTWPCLVVGPGCDIIAANAPLARVVGGDPLELHRNLVRFFLSRTVRERVVNWDEVVTAVVPSTLRQALGGERTTPALRPLTAELEREEPGVLPQLQALWHSSPLPVLQSRVVFPLVWRHADGTALAFNAIISLWDSRVPSWVIDWHPTDAVTWTWLADRTR
ncbi:MAG: helix-turn-helix domain-containing protein [Dehalococcoidia bacterium]